MTDDDEVREIETWRTLELELTAEAEHADPLALEVDAVFISDRDVVIRRPAFWVGGRNWRVRFAPPDEGVWTMSVETPGSGSEPGLTAGTARIRAVPYAGELEIYRHGFLRVSDSGRHFEHADGTPFFYLGDTHWILPHERFDSSNASGVASQFRHLVDLRAAQGFTVYQSEPIWQPHTHSADPHDRADEEPVADLRGGFDASDLAGFANLDRKFAYIADHGLVHANAQITWVLDPVDRPEVFTATFMSRMARYWVARYGSYPVIWTIGQEIDPGMYGRYPADDGNVWYEVGRTLQELDAYEQVIMPHMENTGAATASQSTWKDRAFHHAFAAQIDTWNVHAARDFWEQPTPKPAVVYETRYDGFWADDEEALIAGYRAFQLGLFGYGYGATGVWNDVYSRPDEPLDAGTDYELPEHYAWWFDGAHRPAGDRLGLLRSFYEDLPWWQLQPRFGDPAWSLLADGDLLATIGGGIYVALLAHPSTLASNGVLRGLAREPHTASWFDPRTGESSACAAFTPETGEWRIPRAPSGRFLMLLVRRERIASRQVSA